MNDNTRSAPLRSLWSLAEDVGVEDGDGPPVVVTAWGEIVLEDADEFVVSCLRRMTLGPVSLDNLVEEGTPEEARLHAALERVRGAVVHSLAGPDGGPLLVSAHPRVPDPDFADLVTDPSDVVRLSLFSIVQRVADGQLLMSSPSADYDVHGRAPVLGALLGVVAGPAHLTEIDDHPDVGSIVEIVRFLGCAGLLVRADAEGRFAEDYDRVLDGWTLHEIHFEVRSRLGGPAIGPTVVLPPGEPERPGPEGDAIALPRPEANPGGPTRPAAAGTRGEPAVLALVERERRRYNPERLPLRRLGHLLHQAARVCAWRRWSGAAGPGLMTTERPYLSTTGLYELELHVALGRVDGTRPGLYFYDPFRHSLVRSPVTISLDDALVSAMVATGATAGPPPGALLITARRDRADWAVGGRTHAASLVHAGALQQTLTLCGPSAGLRVDAAPLDATNGWAPLVRSLWPGEVAVGVCALDAEPFVDG